MAYDSAGGVTVLFGGHDGSYDGETWEWDGTSWTPRSSAGPSARHFHAMAYDSAGGVTVLFGGYDGSIYGDTWEWTGVCPMLTLTFINGTWGSVELDPNDPNFPPYTYPIGTEVTLTATPIECKAFKHWEIYDDPNLMGDANYAIVDANLSTTIVMDQDRGVTAVFAGPDYVLTIDIVNPAWGSVDVEPFAPGYEYPACTEVTLHALPKGKNSLKHWIIHDPNHCGDANYAVFDSNDATTIIMDSDKCVTAVFKCGSGIQPLLPVMLGVLGLFVLLRRGREA